MPFYWYFDLLKTKIEIKHALAHISPNTKKDNNHPVLWLMSASVTYVNTVLSICGNYVLLSTFYVTSSAVCALILVLLVVVFTFCILFVFLVLLLDLCSFFLLLMLMFLHVYFFQGSCCLSTNSFCDFVVFIYLCVRFFFVDDCHPSSLAVLALPF